MAMSTIAPVDIVWIIDNSGSMDGEAAIIQRNMDDFVASVESAGLDVRVVVITAPGFVTVDATLAGDVERFLRVEEDVQSSDGLRKLVSTLPRWQSFLRRGSQLHLVAVTDDESGMSADEFLSTLPIMLGRSFLLHSIVSPPGSSHNMVFVDLPGCSGPNGAASDNGDEYWAASTRTGGQRFSICTEDWSALFAELNRAIAIPTTLPCGYDIPPPPAGEEFDPLKVNLDFTRGDGGRETLPNVRTFDRCSADGWYYDNPETPERILLCPTSCTRVENDTAGRVDVAFGCATLLI